MNVSDEKILDSVENSYNQLTATENLDNDPILRQPWGQPSIRLSWTKATGVRKNIISEIKHENDQLWIEANVWKDTQHGDDVYRQFEHFPEIEPVNLSGTGLEDRIYQAVENAFVEVELIQEDDLDNEEKLKLAESEKKMLNW